MALKLNYLIAALPRTGSNLLVRSLTKAGAGRPLQYFQPYNTGEILRESGSANIFCESYVEHLLEHFRDSVGVFGVKCHWQDFRKLEPSANALLMRDCRLFFMRRRNLAMQTLSLEKALTTGKWDPRWKSDPTTINTNADFGNFSRLRVTAGNIIADEARWLDYFATNSFEVTNIYYEDYLADMDATHALIFRKLGLDLELPEREEIPVGKAGETADEKEIIAALRDELVDIEKIRRPLD